MVFATAMHFGLAMTASLEPAGRIAAGMAIVSQVPVSAMRIGLEMDVMSLLTPIDVPTIVLVTVDASVVSVNAKEVTKELNAERTLVQMRALVVVNVPMEFAYAQLDGLGSIVLKTPVPIIVFHPMGEDLVMLDPVVATKDGLDLTAVSTPVPITAPTTALVLKANACVMWDGSSTIVPRTLVEHITVVDSMPPPTVTASKECVSAARAGLVMIV